MKTTVIFAHPYEDLNSSGNKVISERLIADGSVDLRELYKLYPLRTVDVDVEQAILDESDLIVFQFPLRWFGVPSLLKEWMDTVLDRDFAYGPDGNSLKGKRLLVSVTAGRREDMNKAGGALHYEVEDYLMPFKRLASACGMEYLEPVISHGVGVLPHDPNDSQRDAMIRSASDHADRLVQVLSAKHTRKVSELSTLCACSASSRRLNGSPLVQLEINNEYEFINL